MQYLERFDHDGTADDHRWAFAEAMRRTKVVHYRGAPAGVDLTAHYRDLAASAGRFVKRDENFRTGAQGEAEAEWLDIRFDEAHKTETFRHSDTRQPIHTDGAYTSYHFDISFFFCTQQAQFGGATTFIDGNHVVDLLRAIDPPLLAALTSTDVVFDKGDSQRKLARVIRFDDHGPRFNWNHFRIAAENAPETRAMCDAFFAFTEHRIVDAGLLTPLVLAPGEAVLFHDERVLHGRNAFFGPRCLIKGGLNL